MLLTNEDIVKITNASFFKIYLIKNSISFFVQEINSKCISSKIKISNYKNNIDKSKINKKNGTDLLFELNNIMRLIEPIKNIDVDCYLPMQSPLDNYYQSLRKDVGLDCNLNCELNAVDSKKDNDSLLYHIPKVIRK